MEREAQVHAFLLTNLLLVEHIDDVDAIEPVDHADLASKRRAARGIDSTSSEATSGPDSLTVIFAGPACLASCTRAPVT